MEVRIKAVKDEGKVCNPKCMFYCWDRINPCSSEIIPVLTKHIGLPDCHDGYYYAEIKGDK